MQGGCVSSTGEEYIGARIGQHAMREGAVASRSHRPKAFDGFGETGRRIEFMVLRHRYLTFALRRAEREGAHSLCD